MITATTIAIDLRANRITVVVPAGAVPAGFDPAGMGPDAVAVLDIGVRGRLLGLELMDGTGISIADAEDADMAVLRSVRIPVQIGSVPATAGGGVDLAISFARRGDGYELSWPSGNQCWRRAAVDADGNPLMTCSVIAAG